MKRTQLKTLAVVALTMFTFSISAQVFKFSPKNSSIVINGTSNIHDWKSRTDQIKGEMVFTDDYQLKSLSLNIPVKSIKSGERIMDSKTHETLGAKNNPNITFRMTDVTSYSKNGNDIQLVVNGNLTIAGNSRKVAVQAKGKANGSGVYVFNGDIQLKMTDFGMKPPTALLGTLKVGDQVKLVFDVTLEDNQQAYNN